MLNSTIWVQKLLSAQQVLGIEWVLPAAKYRPWIKLLAFASQSSFFISSYLKLVVKECNQMTISNFHIKYFHNYYHHHYYYYYYYIIVNIKIFHTHSVKYIHCLYIIIYCIYIIIIVSNKFYLYIIIMSIIILQSWTSRSSRSVYWPTVYNCAKYIIDR